jgi:hypothetical protein
METSATGRNCYPVLRCQRNASPGGSASPDLQAFPGKKNLQQWVQNLHSGGGVATCSLSPWSQEKTGLSQLSLGLWRHKEPGLEGKGAYVIALCLSMGASACMPKGGLKPVFQG